MFVLRMGFFFVEFCLPPNFMILLPYFWKVLLFWNFLFWRAILVMSNCLICCFSSSSCLSVRLSSRSKNCMKWLLVALNLMKSWYSRKIVWFLKYANFIFSIIWAFSPTRMETAAFNLDMVYSIAMILLSFYSLLSPILIWYSVLDRFFFFSQPNINFWL